MHSALHLRSLMQEYVPDHCSHSVEQRGVASAEPLTCKLPPVKIQREPFS
uniref:Uncharacterized protein n=1 Tax=Anguilla anguilla TaxID=7936 RepID=A0A0E9XU93_ANGAN